MKSKATALLPCRTLTVSAVIIVLFGIIRQYSPFRKCGLIYPLLIPPVQAIRHIFSGHLRRTYTPLWRRVHQAV